jgi:hypothetical protein
MKETASYLVKRLALADGGWVDIVGRRDGTYHFFERVPYDDYQHTVLGFVSGLYVTAEAAEAAARVKFKLVK